MSQLWFRYWLGIKQVPSHHLNKGLWSLMHVCVSCPEWVNSLAPGRFKFNFRKVIVKLTLVNGGWGISNEIALRWMPQDLTGDKSTLIQVMAWCRQATSHYLSQCWPWAMSPNGVTRPQWVKPLWHSDAIYWRAWSTLVPTMACCLIAPSHYLNYRKTPCISRTKAQNLNVSHLVLQSSLPHQLKSGVKLRMEM